MNANKLNVNTKVYNDCNLEVFGIELKTLELPPRANPKLEWNNKNLEIKTRFLFGYYDTEENTTKIYSSAWNLVFKYFGRPEELTQFKEIKRILPAITVNEEYEIHGNFERQNEDLEITYLKWPVKYELKPGDKIRIDDKVIKDFNDYMESFTHISEIVYNKHSTNLIPVTADHWTDTDNNELITNIYGLVYGGISE